MKNKSGQAVLAVQVNRIAVVVALCVIASAAAGSAQMPFVAVSGGATVGDLMGGGESTDSRWGGTAGVSVGFRSWNYFVTSLEGNWVQKGGGETRLDYIEIPLLIGGVAQASNGIGVRLYSGIGVAFPVGCSSAGAFACDAKKGTEWAWPLGLQVGRWMAPNRFVALDVRYSLGLSDAFEATLAANRSWQFRAYVGFPIGGARGP
jgi:hypothetical protein